VERIIVFLPCIALFPNITKFDGVLFLHEAKALFPFIKKERTSPCTKISTYLAFRR
jgi:hypothetical protein